MHRAATFRRNPLFAPLKMWQLACYMFWRGDGGSLARPPVEALVHTRSVTAEGMRVCAWMAAAAGDAAAGTGAGSSVRSPVGLGLKHRQSPTDLQLTFSPHLPSAETFKQQPYRDPLAGSVETRALHAKDGWGARVTTYTTAFLRV
jgi:hypothetical protein